MPKGGKSDIANAISGVISAGTSLSDTARAFATLDYVVSPTLYFILVFFCLRLLSGVLPAYCGELHKSAPGDPRE